MSRLKAVVGLLMVAFVPTLLTLWGGEKDDKLRGRPASEPAATTLGRLILDGELISPPYEVAIVGDDVTINGRSVERPEPRSPAPVGVDPGTEVKHQVLEAVHTAFAAWAAQDNTEVALERVVRFMKGQPLVESVVVDSEASLRVKFRDERHEEILELSPMDPDQPSLAQVREKYLEDRAQAIEYWLSQGNVVILGDGVSMVTPGSEAVLLLAQLEEIVTSHSDVSARAAAIRAVVPDDSLAQAIARRFLQEGAVREQNEGDRR